MFNGASFGYSNDFRPEQEVSRKDVVHQDISDISLDISEFAKHLEAKNGHGGSGQDNDGARGGLFDFGFNGDILSPPSPATIASTTDISGGDYLPPDSSQRSSASNNDVNPGSNQIHRARSVSQPTTFAQRKSNLSLSIPSLPVQQEFQHQTQHQWVPSFDASTYRVNAMTGFTPAFPDSPAAGMMNQDYFSMPLTDGNDVMMSSDQDQTITANHLASKSMMDVRYGYRLPASQPSSPVRSGYPPGQAPYAGHHQAQGRPRGFTTSDVQGHAFFANMGHWRSQEDHGNGYLQNLQQQNFQQHQQQQHQQQQHQQQQQQQQQQHQTPQPQQLQTSQAQQHHTPQPQQQQQQQQPPPSPFNYSPIEPTGYGIPQPASVVGTPQSVQIVNMPGLQSGTHSPFPGIMPVSTTQQSPISPGPSLMQQQTSLQEAVAQMKDAHQNGSNSVHVQANPQNLNLHFNQPTPVNFRMTTEPVLRNPVPHLENQAMSYNLGGQEMQMDPQSMPLQAAQVPFTPSAPPSVSGMSNTAMEESAMDAQTRSLILESRRSSTSAAPQNMTGMNTPAPAPISGFAMSHNGTRTPDITKQVQEKLTFLDNLANSVAQARQEILLGHANAADEYITDVGNAIIEKALSPENIGNPTPSLNLQLPGLGSIVQAQQAPQLAPSPATSLAMTPIHPGSTPNPPSSDPPAQPVLAPPFELKRSRSVKRSAPESPLLANAQAMNKHIKLDDLGSSEVASAPVSAGPGTPVPGQMVHSHSFPDGHLNAMNNQNIGMSSIAQNSSNAATATSNAMLAVQTASRPPTVPSPLGHPVMQMNLDPPFAQAQMSTFSTPRMETVPPNWEFQPDMAANEMILSAQMAAFGQASGFSQPQQTTPSRRGSIVDGRLISNRPSLSVLGHGTEGQTTSTPVVPTLASAGHFSMSGTLAMSTAGGSSQQQGSTDISQSTGTGGRSGNIQASLPTGDDADSDSDSDDDGRPRNLKRRRSSEHAPSIPGTLTQPPDLISPEMRAQLDIILFKFLNRVCSDLDFHDAKGELLHQALMPKKMAKLDESPDFRPFKFRIQAFTNAFAEELQRLGVLEETLSAKKIKSYLWNQKLISRFNEDGKKSKSKGNHIWNVDAKKMPDGSWIFREFKRKIAPTPPTHAYIGITYSWTPRVWDPQASTADLNVTFSSLPGTLPPWLSWQDNVLSGTPSEGAPSAQITALATFADSTGTDHQLALSFPIHIARPGEDSAESSTAQSYVTAHQAVPMTEAQLSQQPFLNPQQFPPGWPIQELPVVESEIFLSTSPRHVNSLLQPVPPQSYATFNPMTMPQVPMPNHFHPGPPSQQQ